MLMLQLLDFYSSFAFFASEYKAMFFPLSQFLVYQISIVF